MRKIFDEIKVGAPIRGEIYSTERLEQYSTFLAENLKITSQRNTINYLLPRAKDNFKLLQDVYKMLSLKINTERGVPAAGSWILENFHIIEEQVREIEEDLPKSYYFELPWLTEGDLGGHPRIYAMALSLIAHQDSHLDRYVIEKYLNAYQKISPLLNREIWAFVIFLRMVLLENLRRLAVQISCVEEIKQNVLNKTEEFIAKKGDIAPYLDEIKMCIGHSSLTDCASVAQMSKLLRNIDLDTGEIERYWESFLAKQNLTIDDAIQRDHQQQAALQVSIGNVITSMRLLSNINWQDFYKNVSLLEHILNKDPANIYVHMDFESCDRYRHVVEKISKNTGVDELEVANLVVALGTEVNETAVNAKQRRHVGYYLIAEGLEKLEDVTGYKKSLKEKIFKIIRSHPSSFYFGNLFLFTVLLMWPIVSYFISSNLNVVAIVFFTLVILLPISDMALSLLNILISILFKPAVLPKLDLAKGIPEQEKTFVVIPTLISGKRSVDQHVSRMEMHYLANLDAQMFFAMLSDFTDSDQEILETDRKLLDYARVEIDKLNEKYNFKLRHKFYLFHRSRLWNESEKKWLGFERKRGKLEEFNHFLRGRKDTTFIEAPVFNDFFKSIRYVITLDSDTQMPREVGRKLVGTIIHPLNYPQIDKDKKMVVKGYGILQPRISIAPESLRRSMFSEIFSGRSGIDPYTTAVSNSYQDLFLEGIFAGKGLYVVDAFEEVLAKRIPNNSILSHDLFEGLFARAALVTDIEFFDDYPVHYGIFTSRLHRWVRGDWQLLPWLFRKVPKANNETYANPFTWISRWKIFDNLRRSLVPISTLLWLFLSWTYLPGNPAIWTFLIVLLLFFPPYAHATLDFFKISKDFSLKNHIKNVYAELRESSFQILMTAIFLPHLAYVNLDAVSRALYRTFVSRKNMLQWICAAEVETQLLGKKVIPWDIVLPVEAIVVIVASSVIIVDKKESMISLAFLCLWTLSPWIIFKISQIKKIDFYELQKEEKALFLIIARKTWHFFETFLVPGDHWLMPDNFQEDPKPIVAHRTSPTNMGGQLISTITAYDLGFISKGKMTKLLEKSLVTMDKLQKAHGHFYNWYNTQTLEPLRPNYVSTVDSGNMAGHLISVKQACLEIQSKNILHDELINGFVSLLKIIQKDISSIESREFNAISANTKQLHRLIDNTQEIILAFKLDKISSWDRFIIFVLNINNQIKDLIQQLDLNHYLEVQPQLFQWTQLIENLAGEIEQQLHTMAPWIKVAWNEKEFDPELWQKTIVPLDRVSMTVEKLVKLQQEISELPCKQEIKDLLQSNISQGLVNRQKQNEKLLELAKRCHQLAMNMDFSILYSKERKIFIIGYNFSEGRPDSSFYDLLASEARLASFFAIAKGDIPTEHWFHLGRQMTAISGERVLISWSASMFEYLMPLLVMRSYSHTILSETYEVAVNAQIKYGKVQKLPWGISESGYNIRDMQFNYQYGPFGVPGMGLMYLSHNERVISPYSTALAALIKPSMAFKNFKRLIQEDAFSRYGFFEAIDYTEMRLYPNQSKAIIRSFMAHHQSMILGSLGNILANNLLQARFHREPAVKSAALLLQERIPRNVMLASNRVRDMEESPSKVEEGVGQRKFTTPYSRFPEVQVLSNGQYTVMITAGGSGFSRCNEMAVSRWQEDAALEDQGQFFYIHDYASGKIFSPTFSPCLEQHETYEVAFSACKAEFWCDYEKLQIHTEVIVSQESNVELRHFSITNTTAQVRKIDIASYMEPVLAAANDDRAHPAFSKLFLETEYIQDRNALLVKRRKRSNESAEVWGLHMISTEKNHFGSVEFETDRFNFIGRGHNVINPVVIAEGKSFSKTSGTFLDPILSIKTSYRIKPYSTVKLCYTTGFARSKKEALMLIDQHSDIYGFERENEMAWIQTQMQMNHLNLTQKDLWYYQQLASILLYSCPALRPQSKDMQLNELSQSNLWKFGISGDIPIVVLHINSDKDFRLLVQLLHAHEYLRLKCIQMELVIIVHEDKSYRTGIHDGVMHQIHISHSSQYMNKAGGIFYLNRSDLSDQEMLLIEFSSRAVIDGIKGSLRDQLNRVSLGQAIPEKVPMPTVIKSSRKHDKTNYDANLEFFNGIGGFANNGSEYEIVLHKGQNTPAPWINVLSNATNFGSIILETGSSTTWSQNSREFRLTPWQNDPVVGHSGEAIYIKDEEDDSLWSATPWPIKNDEIYTTTHGQGYSTFKHQTHGIGHEMITFIPLQDNVKICRIKFRNKTLRTRTLAVTSFTEWVLGFHRSKTAHFIQTWKGSHPSLILARNSFEDEFASNLGFSAISGDIHSFTCDRHEFLGRHGRYQYPRGVFSEKLLQKIGCGHDPCAAIRTKLILEPSQEKEVIVLLGQVDKEEDAIKMLNHYFDSQNTQKALDEVKQFWRDVLQTIQIKTPSRQLDIMFNSWLPYQSLVCRMWARTAFYQSGGAYGFRDQLQDTMALIYSNTDIVREHLLRAAAHQFKEGDVQHWWHPPTDRGVRTHFSDDLLWLVYVSNYYIRVTGDSKVLDESISFLEGPSVPEGKEDIYFHPEISQEQATLYEHCVRAIERSLAVGTHGLPLMGCGDWNDGMNNVGIEGKGESVWVAQFLIKILSDFAIHCQNRNDLERHERFEQHKEKLVAALESQAWDGKWYRRAYFDNGQVLGSAENEECRIDSLAQSWSVLMGQGNSERQQKAMNAVEKFLIQRQQGLVLLFTPPFDRSEPNPGYIKGYPPGIRENGAQYTHAAMWVSKAFAALGDGDRAYDILSIVNPINHSSNSDDMKKYKVEPYVIAADVYSVGKNCGRGGWSWYTGAAGWFYQATLEIVGIEQEGDRLHIRPCSPTIWKKYQVSFKYQSSVYEIVVNNPKQIHPENIRVELNGAIQVGPSIPLVNDGKIHSVQVWISDKNS